MADFKNLYEDFNDFINKVLIYIKNKWKEINKQTKTFIVYGPSRAGKTTWIEFLRTGKIEDHHNGSPHPDKKEDFEFERNDGSIIKFKNVLDVPGEQLYLDKYLRPLIITNEHKAIFYFFSGEKYLENICQNGKSYQEVVIHNLEDIYSNSGKNTQIYVSLTFANKISNPKETLFELYKTLEKKLNKSIKIEVAGYWNCLDMKDINQMNKFKNDLKL